MYMYKYLYGIHVNVHYNLTRSSTTVTIVLNIPVVRVDGWGICRRIKSYNGLPIIIPRCLSVTDLTLSLFVLYFSSLLLCIALVDTKCVYI